MSAPRFLLLTGTMFIAACASVPIRAPTAHPDIRIQEPKANAIVSSPLIIRGEAQGTWYFEASFPVKLVDVEGNVLASVPAQAQDDWMTEDFVPFIATLAFDARGRDATLVLEKDNPSGLPEHAAQVTVPIKIEP